MLETNYSVVNSLMAPYLPIEGLDLKKWLQCKDNVCLLNSLEDLALFEYDRPGIYSGHYFFKSRGRQAVSSSKEFLNFFFLNYPCEVIKGLTPLETLGARWLSRKLGFTSYGVIQTAIGPCELFILTKKDWEQIINE